MPVMKGDYGFIGLGAMGYGMAMNLRKKMPSGSTLYVHDVLKSSCEKFVAEFSSFGRIEIAESAKNIAQYVSNIVSIVPTAADVQNVYLDMENGVIAAAPNPGRLMLECSTIDAATTRSIGRSLLQKEAGLYVDTPVSGGMPGALAGSLTFMVGRSRNSSDPVLDQLTELMSMMGNPDKIFFCGNPGAGVTTKICNNYLSGTILLATAEAMNIGIRSGVDKHILYQVIHNSAGQSCIGDNLNPVPGINLDSPSSKDYQAGAKPLTMVKDLTLAVELAAITGARATLGPAALQVYREASKNPEYMDRDVSVIYRVLKGPE